MSRSLIRRGQLAMEFMAMVAFVLIVGMVFLAAAWRLFIGVSDEERIVALNDLGYTLQDEIILATQVTDGYERTFTIPQKSGRFVYEMSNTNNAIELSSGPSTVSYPIPEISGTLQKGQNTIRKDGIITVNIP